MNVPKTQLPRPNKTRWQPLRGNNGTGKSKVLALTLPFLLDGRATPSRVEPDGDVADAFRNLEAERQELEGVQVAHHTAKEEESQILTQIDETKPGLQQGSEMRDANPLNFPEINKISTVATSHLSCHLLYSTNSIHQTTVETWPQAQTFFRNKSKMPVNN